MKCILTSLFFFPILVFSQNQRIEQQFTIENGEIKGWRIIKEFDEKGNLIRSDSTLLDESDLNQPGAPQINFYGNAFGSNEFFPQMDGFTDSLWNSLKLHAPIELDSIFQGHIKKLKDQFDEQIVPDIIIPESQKNKTKKI